MPRVAPNPHPTPAQSAPGPMTPGLHLAPDARSFIGQGAQVAVSHSGGRDGKAMTNREPWGERIDLPPESGS